MPKTAQHWYFNKRPKDVIEHDTLILREEPIPDLEDGEFLLRSIYMSLDATNRVWMSDWDTYMDPLPVARCPLAPGCWASSSARSSNRATPVLPKERSLLG